MGGTFGLGPDVLDLEVGAHSPDQSGVDLNLLHELQEKHVETVLVSDHDALVVQLVHELECQASLLDEDLGIRVLAP
jgi:hypothetical protein